MEPVLLPDIVVKDTFKATFFTERRAGLFWLLSKKPVSYFSRRSKLEETGISLFYIDVSFCKPDSRMLKELLHQYKTGIPREGSSAFNFKLGLK
jgi:hypothetical protein